MKKGITFVIGVVTGGVIAILLIIGLGVGGWFYIDHKSKETTQKNVQAQVDGREFGKTTDQIGCMDKGFSLETKGSLDYNSIFIGECLRSSRPIPNFCDGVPTDYDNKWVDEQCEKAPNKESCRLTISVKQSYCRDKKK